MTGVRLLRRRPVLAGFVLMFLFTWPVEWWLVAASRDQVAVRPPEPLAIFVGWGFVLAAVLFTWLYQHTRGSLLLAIVFHASINVSAVFLPVMTAVTGDPLPHVLGVVLTAVWAGAVILLLGPRYLARNTWATSSDRTRP